MKARIIHWVPTLFWLGCAGGLAAGIGVESDWGGNWLKPMVRKKFGATVNNEFDLVPPFKLAAMETILPETVERPLMVPTRRPAPPPSAPAAVAPSMVRGQYVLKGTLINTEITTAYLFETVTGKSFGVKKGDNIPGKSIVLSEVMNNRVVLQQGDETESLDLARSSSSPRNPFPTSGLPPPPAGRADGAPFPQPGIQPNPQVSSVVPSNAPIAGPIPPFPTGQATPPPGTQTYGAGPVSADQVPARRRFQNVVPTPPQ
jgi:hypothetical protein